MKHTTLLLALALTATTLFAHRTGRAAGQLVIRDGSSLYVNGHFDDDDYQDLKQKHNRFVIFEKDGHEYVVTDAATVERFKRIVQPQMDLGRQQGELGRQQGELGREQGRLGREQGRIGREQARLATERADDGRREALEVKQRQLAGEQRELAGRQEVLSGRQRELAARAAAIAQELERELEPAKNDAVKRGVAVPRR